jgi:leucyl aminopeptidase (aminopeptidase T)
MSDTIMIDIMKSADILVRKSLDVQEGEQVLIITDTDYEFLIPTALAAATHAAGGIPTLAIMTKRKESGATLIIEQAIGVADVVITATTLSVVHSFALRKSLLEEKKIRVGSTVGTHLKGFISDGANCDPSEIFPLTERIANAIKGGKELRFLSDNGTDIRGSLQGMPIRVAGGFARNRGELTCFPDGEVWLAPKERTAEGVVVIDTNMTFIGPLSEPITYIVKDGKVESIRGNVEASKLRNLMNGIENIDNIAEMAIGTNPRAKFMGELMNDKHVLGSVHVAIGDNQIYGGNTHCDLHIDGVISCATVQVDGRNIIEKGRLTI